MKFISTRGKGEIISSSEAIIKGIADDGGLYVPIEFPNLYDDLKKKMGLSYEELAYEIIGEFFDDIDNKSLKEAINEAYNKKFFYNFNYLLNRRICCNPYKIYFIS